MNERDEFGPRLRRERERRGITLEQIAEQTKISASMFAGLERNDLSRWPGGIFRRSFFRAYAETVGLDVNLLVQEFLRLFPSADDPAPVAEPSAPEPAPRPAHELHIVRDNRDRHPVARPGDRQAAQVGTRARLIATGIDLAIVGVFAFVCWLMFGWTAVWPSIALTATLTFVAGNVVLGATVGAWVVAQLREEPASEPLHLAVPARPAVEERTITKRRTIAEPHQTARRHTVRRVDRSRSSRA